jgi:hypothetical protein
VLSEALDGELLAVLDDGVKQLFLVAKAVVEAGERCAGFGGDAPCRRTGGSLAADDANGRFDQLPATFVMRDSVHGRSA